jgi:hypothetical protein
MNQIGAGRPVSCSFAALQWRRVKDWLVPGGVAVWRTHRQLFTRVTASRAWRGGWRYPARARCSRRT